MKGLEVIKGVHRIDADEAEAIVRCDYDPQRCSRQRIEQAVQFRGRVVR